METIQITPDLRLSIEPDDWYEMDADAREMSPVEIENEEYLIRTQGVWGVILQKKETYTSESGKTLTVWEDIDSIWGNFLDSNYTAQDVAAEHFPDYPSN